MPDSLPPAAPLALVIDDNLDMRDLAARFLGDAGFGVATVDGGQAAIDALLGGLQPQVIVLDLAMPDMDGWDVVRWLQGSRAFARIPLVIWTSGLSQGAVGHARVVGKDSHPQFLIAALRSAMSRSA